MHKALIKRTSLATLIFGGGTGGKIENKQPPCTGHPPMQCSFGNMWFVFEENYKVGGPHFRGIKCSSLGEEPLLFFKMHRILLTVIIP